MTTTKSNLVSLSDYRMGKSQPTASQNSTIIKPVTKKGIMRDHQTAIDQDEGRPISPVTSLPTARPASRASGSSHSPKSSMYYNHASPCDSGFDSVSSSPSSESGQLLKTQANTPTQSSPFVAPEPPAPKDIPFNTIRNSMSTTSTHQQNQPQDPRLHNNHHHNKPNPRKSNSPRPSGSIFNDNNKKSKAKQQQQQTSKSSITSSPTSSPFLSPPPPPVTLSSSHTAANNTTGILYQAPTLILKIPSFAGSPQVRSQFRRVRQLKCMKRHLPIDPMFAADYFDTVMTSAKRSRDTPEDNTTIKANTFPSVPHHTSTNANDQPHHQNAQSLSIKCSSTSNQQLHTSIHKVHNNRPNDSSASTTSPQKN